MFLTGEGGSNKKVVAVVPSGNRVVLSAPKFKRRRVSAVRDFLPGYERVTLWNFGLTRQIAVNRSSEGN
ncbi:hypothetical protein J1N35_005445 [Gossypium stocksii]|uniref:Uncharacterized protein n=1 Tax=Gossypium stocksii TaxID=47602 RepID=A0A9D4AJ99_9ROSI|nr:hypothetical protein J1N35_005445 [Gossypium stocksii]